VTARQPERSAVLTEDMQRVVREQRLGFVATVGPDGTPSLSPKGTTRVWDDEHLVFADIMSPGTVANLRANPAVEINVVDPIARKGDRFMGEAAVVSPSYDLGLTEEEISATWWEHHAALRSRRQHDPDPPSR
jgi:predicted pyridoxine 5'-phosphate oxidase superfamily flavin-nucleotide-binding protein